MDDSIIIGRNPVMEAIRAGRPIEKILVKFGKPEGSMIKLISMAKAEGITVIETDKKRLDQISEGGNNQGVIAYAQLYKYAQIDDILKSAKEKEETPFLVLCDRITDPHNLGSIIRTASGAGAHGVIISKHESVGVNATVCKVAAGAAEFLPIARVSNLAKTIDDLKKQGLWIYGTAADGEQSVHETDFSGPVGIVIGNEGSGMGRLIKEKCDFLLRIPMVGPVESLNASVAAALVMYEVTRSKNK